MSPGVFLEPDSPTLPHFEFGAIKIPLPTNVSPVGQTLIANCDQPKISFEEADLGEMRSSRTACLPPNTCLLHTKLAATSSASVVRRFEFWLWRSGGVARNAPTATLSRTPVANLIKSPNLLAPFIPSADVLLETVCRSEASVSGTLMTGLLECFSIHQKKKAKSAGG
ncbi:hypothetical protein DL98DRAFT_511401 [Cadophora sp. DSE1049]|nr:hypothetical protein DL98DRAFT_511401 [Cadophora sp. DSE1049]